MIPDEERLQNIYICTHCVVACVPSSCIQYGSVLHMRFHNRQEKRIVSAKKHVIFWKNVVLSHQSVSIYLNPIFQ